MRRRGMNPPGHRIPQPPEHERAQDLFLLTGAPGLCFADSRLVFRAFPVANGIRAPRRTELALRWVRGAAAEPRVGRTPLGQDDVGTARGASRVDTSTHAWSLPRHRHSEARDRRGDVRVPVRVVDAVAAHQAHLTAGLIGPASDSRRPSLRRRSRRGGRGFETSVGIIGAYCGNTAPVYRGPVSTPAPGIARRR